MGGIARDSRTSARASNLVIAPAEYLALASRRFRFEAACAIAEQQGQDVERVRGLLREARAAERAARSAAGDELPMPRLAARLGLRPIDEDILLAAVSLEIDLAFATVVTALAGGEPRAGLWPKLLGQILRLTGDDAGVLRLPVGHPLLDAALLEVPTSADNVPESLRPFRAPARVVSYLLGSDEPDRLLARSGEVLVLPPRANLDDAAGPRALLARLLAAGEPLVVCVEGAEGAGRRTIVTSVANELHRGVYSIDAARLSTQPDALHLELRAFKRETWLRGAIPLLARIDSLSRGGAERAAMVARELDIHGSVPGAVVITAAPGAELPEFRRRIVRVRVDAPGPATRLKIWSSALGGTDTDRTALVDAGLGEIAERYTLTPAGIERAAANAQIVATGRSAGIDDIRQGIAIEIAERFGGLATRLSVHHRWEDLVLPQDTYDDIRAFVSRASNATLVYERWGFREKLQRGLGLAALFSGPPGTGKTMVAGLIAQALSLELYLVDLSQVVSKWVGETEKQLGKIFDAAQAGQALLLFDEADALFAKRTEVKSSNDRYANLEVNYLLQRIESFGGVAILTTNLESSVDPAFKRRLAADIHFYPPESDERQRLWRRLMPANAPVAEDIDFAALDDEDMCGGHIRNVVLRAAFLAAAESTSIAQQHLKRAIQSEYRAMGKVV